MKNKLRGLTRRETYIYIIVLLGFAAAAALLGQYILAMVEAGVAVVLAVVALIVQIKSRKKIERYIEAITYESESAKSSTLMNFPLPIAVFRLSDSSIVWGNEMFFSMCGTKAHFDAGITDLVPGFSGKWLAEGKNKYPSLIEISGRKYRVHGNLVRSSDPSEEAYMGITYWVDITEYEDIRIEYNNSRPVAGIIIFDNYDELCRNQTERIKNDIRDAMEDKLNAFADENNAILRRYSHDRYLFVCEQRNLEAMTENKFKIVEEAHEITGNLGSAASISIGIGTDAANFREAIQFATVASELALSRGGDQAVVKNRLSFQFFGGRGDEVEKRNKVKSRVIAGTLSELICDSSKVLIMGHRYSDYDCIGAAAGLGAICRKCGVPFSIVVNRDATAAENLIKKLASTEEYKNAFVNPEQAMFAADGRTLLIVVDTNRPEQVEDSDLLESCNRVAVIDHHRTAATYIHNSSLSFVEPYASSACELVTEIITEVLGEKDLLKQEAEAVLAGIVLDTKSFAIRTGERTFDAAAYLRGKGADTTEVKKLLQTDMDSAVDRYRIMQSAVLYKGVVIAAPGGTHARVVAATAADELLNISGVETAVVVSGDGKGGSFISARSMGDFNVQILMEKLGGGGNRSVAAAQFPGEPVEAVVTKLCGAIDEYLEK